jgi:hypothetical protein
MNEGEVYFYLKQFLLDKGWGILAGEPPDGSDDLPRVEIRNRNKVGIGSKGSYKIDLIGFKDNVLLLIELKPKFNQGDIDKLNIIKSERLEDLFSALNERCGLKEGDFKEIIKCIGVGDLCGRESIDDFLYFLVRNKNQVEIIYGDKIPTLFSKN